MKKLYSIGFGAIILTIIALYALFALPTKIALVNFRDAQMAEVVMANDNYFIQPKQIDLKEDDFSQITSYPVIFLSHVSMLTDVQKNNLQLAIKNGGKVHVLMATSKENDLSNILGKDLDYITTCFSNNGGDNIKKWLNYSRKILDSRSLFVDEITEPKTFPSDVFYRIGTKKYFEKATKYWDYYKEEGLYKNGKPIVAIVNSSASPQTLFRSYQDSIILNMEQRGYNVVVVSGFTNRLKNLKTIAPDMVMYFPHGRLQMMKGQSTVDWLKERNILMMTPQLVYQNYEDWIADQQGMAGGIFGQNIVVPELDGAIHPYAVAAQYMNKQGFHTFKPIPGRINTFCETAQRWLALKKKPNQEKKLSIFYYKGAGKNALVAGGLEVGQSIYSLLKRLKEEGYDLGNLPQAYDSFIAIIDKKGPLLGDYALGAFDKFVKEGDPALISVNEYESWCKSELDPKSYEEVKAAYGQAPGTYMTTTINDTAYFAIPRVQFGNVSLLPVLASALDENEYKSVHGIKKAPPHAYVASYLWPRMKEKVDVVAHFGAHGSVEFTPSKQVVLSKKDWAEALIAPIPHLYIYSVDNIGEAMMAKRRSYATMVSHLTPPQAQADLHGGLQDISTILHNFSTMPNGLLKEEYRKGIIKFADTLDLAKDLGLSEDDLQTMPDETVQELHDYVHHLEKEKITIGLHVYGEPYTAEELNDMVKMMSVDPIAQSLSQIAKINGGLPHAYESHQHGHDFSHGHGNKNSHKHGNEYDDLALHMVTDVLEHGTNPRTIIPLKDRELLKELIVEYGIPKGTVISEYYGGSYNKKKRIVSGLSGEENMVYDQKTHKMIPQSKLSKPASHNHSSSSTHHEDKEHKAHSHDEENNKEKMVYDHKTHKMVSPSSINNDTSHDHDHGKSSKYHDNKEHKALSHGEVNSREKMVYDYQTHKMVAQSSIKGANKKSAVSKSNDEYVYDPITHKMIINPLWSISTLEAQNIAVHLAAQRKTVDGVEWIKDEKTFEDISSLLNETQLHKFNNTAEMDEEIKKKVAVLKDQAYRKLLRFTQEKANRIHIIDWLQKENTKAMIISYRASLDSLTIMYAQDQASTFLMLYQIPEGSYQTDVAKQGRKKLQFTKHVLTFYQENKEAILDNKDNQADLVAIQAILKSKSASQIITNKINTIDTRLIEIEKQEKKMLATLLLMQESLAAINEYKHSLLIAPKMELDAFINGMDGGFVVPSSGGDPIGNPLSVPTGKNLYSINEQVTPTKEAYELGKRMAEQILQKHIAKHGEYPKKIAYSLWSGEFIRNQGLNVGQILYMLGVEPVRNQRGRVHDVQLIPMDKLQRPRIDVVVQTSGQFRDLAASRIYLINKAITLATNAEDASDFKNYVKEGTDHAEAQMKEKGMSPADARKFSTVRVFGGVNGNYGTGIMELVEQGDKWDTEEEIAERYMGNMGAMYSEDNWSDYKEGMFEIQLQNTEVVVHPRSSNLTGPISLDHVYEFMGGITASVRVTTGKDPDGYFNDFRNKYDPKVQGLKEAIWTETRTNFFNPKFIKAQMKEGETAAEGWAENFRDTYGWNVMKPNAIDKEIWEGYYDIYIKDSLALGTVDFMEKTNPYALQEMTAVMLETIRKGYWKPQDYVTQDIVNLHAKLIIENEAGCSGFVCDNEKLKEMIANKLSGEEKDTYIKAISAVRIGKRKVEGKEGLVLTKQENQSFSEIVQNNRKAIISLLLAMLIIGGSLTWGIVKRRKEE